MIVFRIRTNSFVFIAAAAAVVTVIVVLESTTSVNDELWLYGLYGDFLCIRVVLRLSWYAYVTMCVFQFLDEKK